VGKKEQRKKSLGEAGSFFCLGKEGRDGVWLARMELRFIIFPCLGEEGEGKLWLLVYFADKERQMMLLHGPLNRAHDAARL
jgi:photosystem II stability/assembly factor-like uncharacterized protein